MNYLSEQSKRIKNNSKIIARLIDKLNPEVQIKALLAKEKEHSSKITTVHVMPSVIKSENLVNKGEYPIDSNF